MTIPPYLQQLVSAEVRLASPRDDARDLVEALVLTSVAVDDQGALSVRDKAGDARYVIENDGTIRNMTVRDLIDELAATKPSLFGPADTSKASSGSTDQTATPNPYRRGESWSLTQQMILERTNPDLAERLEMEAAQ